MANITGGGIPENLPRCIPDGLLADIDYDLWTYPKIFNDIMKAGDISHSEMIKTFNMGIGYCIVVPEHAEEDAHDTIDACGYKSFTIGKIINK